MKPIFSLLALLFFLLGFPQQPVSDTAQVIVSGRYNSSEAQDKPYVIMISADGFRHDYAQKYNAKNLLKIAEKGVSAKAMLPAFPSVTGPNHYTLVTGLHPSHSGFVDNYFYDKKRNDYFAMSRKEKISDGTWLGGIPLWSLAEQQRTLSASLFWVASNSDAGGTRPTYYYNYHEKFSVEQKIKIVLDWLKLPEEKRPHFITFYFPEADQKGHFFGPESEEVKQAVQFVDSGVGKLMEEVAKLGLPNVNYIFVSDHGMMRVDAENPIKIPEVLKDKNRFTYINAQTLLRVHVKNPKEIKSVYKKLKKEKTEDYKVYLPCRFVKRLKYSAKDDNFSRIGDIILMPSAPKVFEDNPAKIKLGKHGYDPKKVPEMKATFYAVGPQFKENLKIKEFKNVDVYHIVAKILGLEVSHSTDGKANTAKKILK